MDNASRQKIWTSVCKISLEREATEGARNFERLPVVDAVLEMESDLSCEGTRCHVVRATECGKEVVQRVLIGQIDGGKLKADLVLVPVKHVVVSDGNIEEMTCSNSLRVTIGILFPGRRYLHQSRTVQLRRAGGKGCKQCRVLTPAKQSRLQLLVPCKNG